MQPKNLFDSINNNDATDKNSLQNVLEMEDQIEEVVEVFVCEEDGCPYTTGRKDNLKRHQKQKHENFKVVCSDCGLTMRPTSLGRHKSTACRMEKSIKSNKKTTSSVESVEPPVKKRSVSSVQSVEATRDINDNASLIKVETLIRVKSDDTIEFTQVPVELANGLEIILVPTILSRGMF